jgi:hypothetical protein
VVPLNSHLPQNQVYQYQVELDKNLGDQEKVKNFLSSSDWPVEKQGKKPKPFNLRHLIREVSLSSEECGTKTARWILEPGSEGEVRPELVLKSIFNFSDEVIQGLMVARSLYE